IQAGGWSDLAVGWCELEATLRRDHGAGPLPDDPTLEMGSPWKRRFKRFTFKVLRPLMRRYDRITADLALLGLETSQELASARGDTAALTSEVQRLRAELRVAQATWDTLRTEFARRLHEHDVRVGTATADRAALTRRRGEGQFLSMLRDWGWRVLGMDISPQAVRSCIEQGFDAIEGSLPDFLATYDGEAPHGMSAIQVVEHLEPATWLPLMQLARTVLAPGGAFVIETIYPLNVDALATWFFGDITHTWPANPETLRVMAGFAGFDRTEVRLMNEDADGRPQDYALIARTA